MDDGGSNDNGYTLSTNHWFHSEEAKGTGKVIIKRFNATVANNALQIRLCWAGKGTVYIPNSRNYGLLTSAISVCRGKSCIFLISFPSM